MEVHPTPMEIDTSFVKKGNAANGNKMEFGMQMARHMILNEIKNGSKKNVVVSPLSLHAMLNMVASGCKGRTLEQLLSFLESDSISQLNAQSSQIMDLTTTSQEFLEVLMMMISILTLCKLEATLLFLMPFGGSSPSVNQEKSFVCHGPFFGPFPNTFAAPVGRFDNGIAGSFSTSSNFPAPFPNNNGNRGLFMSNTCFPPFSLANGDAGFSANTSASYPANGHSGLSASKSHQGPIISFVNGIWVDRQYNLKPSFKQLAEDVYKAKADSVDFGRQAEQVTEEVNLWAKNATKGLIDKLIPPGFFNPLTGLALANALYFKGTWLHTFDASRTRNEDFHLLDGKTIKAPFMISYSSRPQFYGSFEGFKLLKMPYIKGKDNKQYSMFIFLPYKKDGLKELVQKFNSDSSFLHKKWDLRQVELSEMWIPKLKFSYDLTASDIMKELGLNLLFEKNEELTEIVDCPDVFVSGAIHKAYIEVNEEGTVAAAVTVMSFQCQSLKYPQPSFVADHPFMFMIKEESYGSVLFTGAVLNPL